MERALDEAEVARTLGDVLVANATRFPDKVVLFNDQGSYTHKAYFERVKRIAVGLYGRGVDRQDRVAFLMGNGLDILCLFGAAELAGYIAVPLNWRLATDEIERTVDDCKPKVLIFDPRYADIARRLAELPDGPTIVLATSGQHDFAQSLEALIEDSDPDAFSPRATPDDIAYLIYTSGSSGRPKGVMLDQKGQLAAIRICALEMRLTSLDRAYISMPLFHVGAKFYQSAATMVGGCAYVAERYVPAAALDSIERHRLTVMPLVPTMLESLLEQPTLPTRDLSSMRTIVYTGAAMPRPVIERGLELLGPRFLQMYGQTENLGGTYLYPQDHAISNEPGRKVLASVGRPGLLSSVKIVDERGRTCPQGQPGEVLLKSDAIMRGYWNNSVATLATVKDGWVWTGDIGVIDEQGLLFIVGRRKDMIITGGENVFAGEVEAAILRHPAILQAAVVGVPDARWGEAIQAIVVCKPGQLAEADDIIKHCAGLIASYKKPKHVAVVAELPRNPVGKIDKRLLREQYATADAALPA